ncbi:hypothetical protein AMTRI_Chr09g38040 [Amborella trichopoda]
MPREAAKPNKFMFPSLLKACNLRSGLDGFIQSTLIDIYANAGCLDYSSQVFYESSQFNVVCCTVMIKGYIRFGSLDKAGQLYVQMGRHKEAFSLFHEMQLKNIKPNQAILAAVLLMSSSLCSLYLGRWIHAYMIKSRVSRNPELSTSMVDMYSKCEALEMAMKLFRKILTKYVGSWNVMISGLAMPKKPLNSFMRYRETRVCEDDRGRDKGNHPERVV